MLYLLPLITKTARQVPISLFIFKFFKDQYAHEDSNFSGFAKGIPSLHMDRKEQLHQVPLEYFLVNLSLAFSPPIG